MDVHRLPSIALDTGFPAGMTGYLKFVYNNEHQSEGTIEVVLYIVTIALLLPAMPSLPYGPHFGGNLFQTQFIGFNLAQEFLES